MKKSFAVLLAALMLFGLAACGGSTSSSASTDTSAAETTEAAETQAAASEAPAATAAPVDTSALEGSAGDLGGTVADVKADPFDAMKEEFISYPLEADTITMWYYTPPYQDFMDSNNSFPDLATAEEKTGIHLEITEVGSTTANEQFNLMVAGGDMTDLIPCVEYYTGGVTKAYEEGIIVDIGEYIDDCMPNYKAVLDCLDDATVKATQTEGMTLAFYQIKDGTYSGNGLVSRGDWIEEQGVNFSGSVISLDEFTDYLRTIHDAYSVPHTIYMTDGTVGINAAFDVYIPTLQGDGFMTSVSSAIFRRDDEVVSGWTQDGYREYLEWCLQMFDEGIMDQDFLSLDTDRMVQNQYCADGTIGVWQANADKITEIVDTYGADNPSLKVQALPRVAKDPDAQYVWNDEASLIGNGGFSLSSSCENPELVCEWENYFWTYEGYFVANYGTEGESYHMDGDTPVFDWDQPVTITGQHAPNAEMAQQLWTMLRFASFYVDNDMLLATFPQEGLDAVKLWTVEGSTDARNYPTPVQKSITTEQQEEINEYESDLLTYTAETCLKFLTGETELNDDTWQDFVDTCDQMGLNDIIAVYQEAYDAYYAE